MFVTYCLISNYSCNIATSRPGLSCSSCHTTWFLRPFWQKLFDKNLHPTLVYKPVMTPCNVWCSCSSVFCGVYWISDVLWMAVKSCFITNVSSLWLDEQHLVTTCLTIIGNNITIINHIFLDTSLKLYFQTKLLALCCNTAWGKHIEHLFYNLLWMSMKTQCKVSI